MAFNVSLNLNKSNQIAGLALANVEALAVAGGEGSTVANGLGERYKCSLLSVKTGLDCMAQNNHTCVPRKCN